MTSPATLLLGALPAVVGPLDSQRGADEEALSSQAQAFGESALDEDSEGLGGTAIDFRHAGNVSPGKAGGQ